MFPGLPREMIDFFIEIRLNNHAAFFEANRKRYEKVVKEPLHALAQALAPIVSQVDPLLDTRPGRAVSRIRRDTRFSKDKSPYRDHMWIGWRRQGEERMSGVGLFWEISPESTRWGCGVYSDRRTLMENMRRDMLASPQHYQMLLQELSLGKDFTLEGNAYKRLKVPEELPEDLTALYLKKGFWVQCVDRPENYDLAFGPGIVERLAADYARLAPLYRLMRELEG